MPFGPGLTRRILRLCGEIYQTWLVTVEASKPEPELEGCGDTISKHLLSVCYANGWRPFNPQKSQRDGPAD